MARRAPVANGARPPDRTYPRTSGRRPRQQPYRKRYESGTAVWIARVRVHGRTIYVAPTWNGGRSSFELKSDAQRAIDEELQRIYGGGPVHPETLGGYLGVWLAKSHRSERTDRTNRTRVKAVLDVRLDGRPLREWEFDELRRRHVHELVDHLLRTQGRAVQGVRNIVGALSIMCEGAIDDDLASVNPFKGLRLRRNDKRAQKPSREIRVWSFEDMRRFAAGGRPEVRKRTLKPDRKDPRKDAVGLYYPPHDFEAMLLAPGLLGVRLGELLALLRADFDGKTIRIRGTAHQGRITGTTDEKNHDRVVPVPPSLAALIQRSPTRIDTELLFPTPRGRLFTDNFRRDVWVPAQRATSMNPTPHEFRHSYVTHLRAAGIDPADLADVAGHTVETATSRYTHPLRQSYAEIRQVIG